MDILDLHFHGLFRRNQNFFFAHQASEVYIPTLFQMQTKPFKTLWRKRYLGSGDRCIWWHRSRILSLVGSRWLQYLPNLTNLRKTRFCWNWAKKNCARSRNNGNLSWLFRKLKHRILQENWKADSSKGYWLIDTQCRYEHKRSVGWMWSQSIGKSIRRKCLPCSSLDEVIVASSW